MDFKLHLRTVQVQHRPEGRAKRLSRARKSFTDGAVGQQAASLSKRRTRQLEPDEFRVV